ncbi:hypothetical protein [Alicyclobacillus acidocaldarius]|uniref:Uncharacterized protein n=1 Tax=Alicyclobacillus acidocaldarius subsp. acidocaldarius (strain ATCC 27009 / DSM 446 / BCRC 14685 / JCM 5260 / KCTC 1825 / NBRC 15652 / NCIMB 11725 / NRRL B-14509 / 104-IA) TaxID=521098 RepID=C8WVT7_ALIAD|nr:hypothetical protein [Alicyclobacillus acidocaldarius]ACV58209.1 hypothetical protein Aaci_1178 [Alicyclobacillus acidocaldarius subsp. acidocaldarius DSM 446]
MRGLIRSPTRLWRWQRAGTGTGGMLVNLIWLLGGISLATAGGLLLGSTLLDGVFPAALRAFTAMFGA